MPTMQDSASVPANATSTNQIAGQLYEFVPDGARYVLSCTGSATGLRATFINNIPLINDQAINLQNRFPILPDDKLSEGLTRAGRLVLTFRNTTAGALTAFWRVDLL
jgi:hypothetical protein